MDNKRMDAYKAARASGHNIPVKPGDKPPVKGLDAVAAAGQNIAQTDFNEWKPRD